MVQRNGRKRRIIPTHRSLQRRRHVLDDTLTAFKPNVPEGTAIRPTILLGSSSGSCPYDISWYDAWVRRQLELQPRDLYSVIVGETEASTIGDLMISLTTVWHEVWLRASMNDSSMDNIVTHLIDKELVKANNHDDSLTYVRNLVFAIIGWQTMLYKPDMGSCSQAQLAIVDETDGHRGYAFTILRQDHSASKKVLHEFLIGFGLMLPCYEFDALASDDDKQALKMTKVVSPNSLNADLLTSVGNIQIKWTDSLACHLEMDRDSSTLYIFRFPTFCTIHLLKITESQTESTLHSCAAPEITSSYWATREDIDDLLREVLLSYRLLFGQNKASRRLFCRSHPFEHMPEECKDPLLYDLCCRKRSSLTTLAQEADSYVLRRDFPILHSRLAILAYNFSNKRPRTWKELWNDKRNSASWFTFWAVLIIGGIATILAFLQVILQIAQIVLQVRGS